MIENEFTADLTVLRRQVVADGVVALDLADTDGAALPCWQPGAHIDLMLADGLVRQYSLCGDPSDTRRWRIAVLLEPDGRGGSRHVHEHLHEGAAVRVRGPRNNFPLVAPRNGGAPRYLFLAGGIGITPIMAMAIEAERAGRDWQLLYLGRSLTTMAFAGGLAGTYWDRVRLWADDERGVFDLAELLGTPRQDTQVYCCGPEPLLAAVEQHCASWPSGSLHVERFAARKPEAVASSTFHVVCQQSGVTVEVGPDASILEALEDADVPIMSSCAEGVCGTCEVRVLDGVPEHRDSVLTEAQRAAGDVILACVSRCRGEKLVLDI